MHKIWEWIKDNIRNIIMILIFVSCLALVSGIILLFCCVSWISKEQIITGIFIPMICALIGGCITIAMDNSLSNEKLKIALERLKWRRKYRYKNENGEREDGTKTDWFDIEYKLIYKNRGKSFNDIKVQMENNQYWDEKFSRDAQKMRISKEDAKKNWIEDRFIY